MPKSSFLKVKKGTKEAKLPLRVLNEHNMQHIMKQYQSVGIAQPKPKFKKKTTKKKPKMKNKKMIYDPAIIQSNQV